MKIFKKILLLLCLPVVVGGMLFFQNCDPGETNPADFLDDTTWELESVKLDGVDVTASFSGLELVLEKTTGEYSRKYKCNNAKAPIWPSSGTFIFTGRPNLGSLDQAHYTGSVYPWFGIEMSFLRSTTESSLGADINTLTAIVNNDTPRKLTFKFSWNGTSTVEPGRTTSVGGKYEFVFRQK